jgi:hypothetical protein
MDITSPVGPPLNEKEAAAAIGISRATLVHAVNAGTIPAPRRIGNLKLYPRPLIWALLNGEPLKHLGSDVPSAVGRAVA